MSESAVTILPEQIAELNQKLSAMRHNVNNHLALIAAAAELIRRKPDLALRMVENIGLQPDRVSQEIRAFSEAFEAILTIKR